MGGPVMSITHDGGRRKIDPLLRACMAIHSDFAFVGRLCLDFAQTGDMGWGTRYERLTSPSELGRWLKLCPLHVAIASITAADVGQASRLRKAIWQVSEAVLAGRKPGVADVRRLNIESRRAGVVREL